MNLKEKTLIKACTRNDLKTIQELFKDKHQINNKFKKKSSYSIDLNCRESNFKMTPLMIASLKGSREIVLFLISLGANILLKDTKGNTALQLACMKQRFHVIDTLLKNKANQNEKNNYGWNCLITAVNCFHEESAMNLLLLLQTGADLEQYDNNGLTCIDHAVRKNKINALRVMLNFNPKIAKISSRALLNASIKGYFDLVFLLLNFGVNPNKIEPTNGSSALHEAVRYRETRNEKYLYERIKIVKYLVLYGASPELKNKNNETPVQIALQNPKEIANQYILSINHFYSKPQMTPKFSNYPSFTNYFPDYPMLKPNLNWTKNDPKYFSSYKKDTNNIESVTNLLDGDPHSMCSFDNESLNWVTFDFKYEHLISKIRIYGWKSREMPMDCFLQVSNNIDGPWSCVQSFKCEMIGSSIRSNSGIPIDFNGFNSRSRYWRLVIARNHGALKTSFHGIEFFGYDCRITKILKQLGLTEYEDILILNDLNQIEDLLHCTYDQFEMIPIDDKTDKQKLWDFMIDFQAKATSIKKLEWFNEPIIYGLVGKPLPAFSVTSCSYLIDCIQLLSHGGGILNGELCVETELIGDESSSIAIFRNISFVNSGKFIIEARSTSNPEISICSQSIQIFELNDPEYFKLVNTISTINNYTKSELFDNFLREKNDLEIQDQLEDDYGFPYFSSFDNNSKIKINKWLSKSSEIYDDENLKRNKSNQTESNFDEYLENQNLKQEKINLTNETEYETLSATLEFFDEISSVNSDVMSLINQSVDENSKENNKKKEKNFQNFEHTQKKHILNLFENQPSKNKVPIPPPLPENLKITEGLLKFQKTKINSNYQLENSLHRELKSKSLLRDLTKNNVTRLKSNSKSN